MKYNFSNCKNNYHCCSILQYSQSITIFRTALTHFSALYEHKTDGKVRKKTH